MKHTLFALAIFVVVQLNGQAVKPDLQNAKAWTVVNRTVEAVSEGSRKTVRLNGAPSDGLMQLNNYQFTDGVIEFDVKGKNVPQQSFVGIAFHVQDEKTYDAVYFRPFNFSNPDTMRRMRAVQYISMPDYPWEKLRSEHPGKYENKVNPAPVPDDWFHVRVIVEKKTIQVFVNNSTKPSLEVNKLNSINSGGIGLWVGNNSAGSFSDLKITPGK